MFVALVNIIYYIACCNRMNNVRVNLATLDERGWRYFSLAPPQTKLKLTIFLQRYILAFFTLLI